MKIVAFGEVLWDIYEDKALIGGAPFNFSAHLSRLGAEAYLLTSVGGDYLYNKTMNHIQNYRIKDDFVSTRYDYPTGTCRVACDQDGQPSYTLAENTAFDHIQVNQSVIDKINGLHFNAFYFGTLAQRGEQNRQSLSEILKECRFDEVFCDLNLRPNCYQAETVEFCLEKCTILKISREEYGALLEYDFCNIKESDFANKTDFYKALAAALSEKYAISTVIITLDKDGALVYTKTDGTLYLTNKPKSKVLSAVGAGDSFSACFLYHYLSGAGIPDCAEKAVLLSDYVVSKYESVPEYTSELEESLLK